MLEAEQLLEQPYAWQGLKRALKIGPTQALFS